MLADLGADVIHVEKPSPAGGRQAGSGNLQGGRVIVSNIGYVHENTNCNKRSMVLDLSKDE